MDKNEYAATIKKLRVSLSENKGDAGGVTRTRATGTTWIAIDSDISFLYLNSDLYILAVRVKDVAYRFNDSDNFTIPGGTVKTLGHAGDYKGLGWIRTGPITVSLNDVNQALENIRYLSATKAPEKKSMLRIVIAFAEGIRFNTVALKVVKGESIASADVSWDAVTGTRVLKHNA